MNPWKYIFVIEVFLVLQSCGQPDDDGLIAAEIYNGNDATPSQLRWMAWIKRVSSMKLLCGGAVLSDEYVVTAASCVQRPGKYQVVLGDYDRSSLDGSEVIIDVSERHLHPDYKITRTDYPLWSLLTLESDIALLKLKTPADLSSNNITKLNKLSASETDEQIMNGSTRCLVAGWGYNYFGGSWMLSPRLQELEIHIMNETRCSEIMLETYDPVTRLCYENTDSGSCMGDNGGAWVCEVNNKWTLVAIQSYGISHDGCRGGGRAGTRISYYKGWIKIFTKPRKRKRLKKTEKSPAEEETKKLNKN